MPAELFLTAVITCSTGQAMCSSYELEDYTMVSVCGVLSEDARDKVDDDSVRRFEGILDGTTYRVEIRPFCEAY